MIPSQRSEIAPPSYVYIRLAISKQKTYLRLPARHAGLSRLPSLILFLFCHYNLSASLVYNHSLACPHDIFYLVQVMAHIDFPSTDGQFSMGTPCRLSWLSYPVDTRLCV